jgi:hypothetical protein
MGGWGFDNEREVMTNEGKVVNLFGDRFAEQITEPQHPAGNLDEDDPFGLDKTWRDDGEDIVEAMSNGVATLAAATSGAEFFSALRDIREEADRWV